MLRAIIFDFNGVLVNDEPLHLELFQKVLAEEGITLSEADYRERYLGMDDRGCFKEAYRSHGRTLDDKGLDHLIRRKARYYREAIEKGAMIFPGVRESVPRLCSLYPLAIASGALRSEIELILQSIGLRKYFQAIVSAEDISEGKPHPGVFIKALERLNQGREAKSILPSECLVIEDSREGVAGAHRAGMKCLAVANSYSPERLRDADAVVKSLGDVTVELLKGLFR